MVRVERRGDRARVFVQKVDAVLRCVGEVDAIVEGEDRGKGGGGGEGKGEGRQGGDFMELQVGATEGGLEDADLGRMEVQDEKMAAIDVECHGGAGELGRR